MKWYKKCAVVCLMSCSSVWSVTADVLLEKNVPSFNEEATKVIPFYSVKNPMEPSLRADFLSFLKRTFGVEIFVETGTHFADTTKTAAHLFSQVFSVEPSNQLYQRACRQLLSYDNVSLYQGDSSDFLKSVFPALSKRPLFYLNNQPSQETAHSGRSKVPLLEELSRIAEAKQDSAVILIGDLHLFQTSLYAESNKEPVDLKLVIDALLRVNPSYQICCLGDALLAYPAEQAICVTSVVRACTIHRLSVAFPEFSERILLDADRIISRVSSNERKELLTYYMYSWTISEMDQGLRSFAALWCGLVLINDGKLEEGILLLTHAANNSLADWRVHDVLHSVVIPGAKTKNYKI